VFVYRGMAMRNHNHLLGVVGGVDGIKTGYTRASGFNLVTSVHRDGRYIIAVVLGRHSASERDAQMRELINAHIKEASLRHSAPVIVERAEQQGDTKAAALATTPHTDATPMASVDMAANGNATVGSNDPIQPLLVKTITYRTVTLQTEALGPMPAVIPVPTVPQPRSMRSHCWLLVVSTKKFLKHRTTSHRRNGIINAKIEKYPNL
jgi:D-alanyl-D-alanine carboxypeptidase